MHQATKPTILIVDDEPETVRALSLSLRGRGYPAAVAGNAAEALGLLGDPSRFDLVLTDYSMPGINGVEFLDLIRAIRGGLPVILMTAYGNKEMLVEALRRRCNGFLEKPFTVEELVAEIERVTGQAAIAPPAGEIAQLMPMLVHQLNNSLNVIISNAELGMVQSAETDPLKARLRTILEASRKIERLNREILDLGKGLDGGSEILDARTVLCDCLDSFAVSAELQGVGINRRLDDGRSFVYGNSFALEQMFCNLIANGIEALSDRPSGRLTVRLFEDPAGASVVTVFGDNGCGMPPEAVERIFTPYYTTKKHGTGLGLAVVQRVVAAHRGQIAVASTVGKGTEITVALPLFDSSVGKFHGGGDRQESGSVQ